MIASHEPSELDPRLKRLVAAHKKVVIDNVNQI